MSMKDALALKFTKYEMLLQLTFAELAHWVKSNRSTLPAALSSKVWASLKVFVWASLFSLDKPNFERTRDETRLKTILFLESFDYQ